MFGGITSYVMGGLLLTILLMSGAGYWYFSYSQREISTLRENAAKLEQAMQTQQQAIQAMEQHARSQAQHMLTLQTDLSGADSARRSLESRLRRMNIQLMARTNSGELERSINQATTEVFADLERITASQSVAVPAPATRPARVPSAAAAVNATAGQPPPRPPVRSSP